MLGVLFEINHFEKIFYDFGVFTVKLQIYSVELALLGLGERSRVFGSESNEPGFTYFEMSFIYFVFIPLLSQTENLKVA